jgi:hypothetical protein
VAIVAIAVAVAGAGVGAGMWLHGRNGHASGIAASTSTRKAAQPKRNASTAPTQSSTGSLAPTASPSLSPTATATGGNDTVSVTPAVAEDPRAQPVVTFLDEYFTAINAHDYQGYVALLSPQMQQAMTLGQFNSGYDGTIDSAETLNGISTAADGDTVAALTFTSHQNPDSLNQEESCTNWSISIFLGQGANGYMIDPSPSDYRASSAPC